MQRKIMAVHMLITQDCNFRCKYCFVAHQPRFMTKTTLFKTLDYLVDPAVAEPSGIRIEWFGGEPLMAKELLFSGVDYAKTLAGERGVKVINGIVSNMSLITPEMIQEIKRRDIGMLASYDGKHTHNFSRHPGSAKLVYDNIKMSVAAGLRVGVAMQVMSGQVGHIYENFRDVESTGAPWVAFNPVVHKFDSFTEAEWGELAVQFDKVCDHIFGLKMKAGVKGQPPFRYAQLENQLAGILQIAKTGKTNHSGDWSCGACKGSVAIDPEGYIVPCHHMPSNVGYDEWILGHVSGGGIDANLRNEFTKTKFEDCGECAVVSCAPCRAINKSVTGSEFTRTPGHCRYQRVLYEAAVKLHNRLVDAGYFDEQKPTTLANPVVAEVTASVKYTSAAISPVRNTQPNLQMQQTGCEKNKAGKCSLK